MTVVTADEIRRRRLARGWSQNRLRRELDVTNRMIQRLERSGPAGDDERLMILTVLGRCGEDENPHADGCILRDCSCECHLPDEGEDGEVIARVWRGLTEGFECLILGPRGKPGRVRYRFVRYYRNPAQEYVELIGPRGETRTVKPDEVRDIRGQELTGAPVG